MCNLYRPKKREIVEREGLNKTKIIEKIVLRSIFDRNRFHAIGIKNAMNDRNAHKQNRKMQ